MIKPIRAIIADDEELLRSHLKTMLMEVWPELQICGEAANGEHALELIHTERPDVAFLDIRMPGMSGVDVAARLTQNCLVVFISAYDQYAIDAFEKAAVDYILKPITYDRLKITISRLKQRLQATSAPDKTIAMALEQVKQLLGKQQKQHLEWLRVQDAGSIHLLPVDEVIFFRASDKYTEVMTASSEHLIRTSIKQLTLELDPNRFWQIHRKTIVNVSKIAGIERSMTGRFMISLSGRQEQLTVSRPYNHLFRQM